MKQLYDKQHRSNNAEDDNKNTNTNLLLKELLLDPDHLSKGKIIGSGCFGDVYRGDYMGETVAIKTMKEVTEASMKDFRAEILLTATLRHPNIINLVGACWTKELTCMVLEWADRGTLGDLLDEDQRGASRLSWENQMLKISTDIARGLICMHTRRWWDEVENRMQETVIHRDLKPDNVLITDTYSAKLSDFGLSTAKKEGVEQSQVGTPLFAAPEVLSGERYDQSADAYSYGVLLLAMCVEGPILDYFGDEYELSINMKKKNWMDVIQAIVKGWRPRTMPHAPQLISHLIMQCMSKNPQERPPFMDVVRFMVTMAAKEINDGIFPRSQSALKAEQEKKVAKVADALHAMVGNAPVQPGRRGSANQAVSSLAQSAYLATGIVPETETPHAETTTHMQVLNTDSDGFE